MGAKTSYDDPTNATDPPGGKHHDATKKSNDGPSGHKRDDVEGDESDQTSVDDDAVSKAEK
jgi:hypothetical protein